MTPVERLLTQAWEDLNKADFHILQAMTDAKQEDPEFDPKEAITKAIAFQTISSQKLTQAKDLLKS